MIAGGTALSRPLPLGPWLLAMVGLGAAALSIFGLNWVDGYGVSEAATTRCAQDVVAGRVASVDDCSLPRTVRVEMTRADISEFFSAVDDVGGGADSAMTPVSEAFYRWGAISSLVVTAGVVLLWMFAVLPATVPAGAAGVGAAWYVFSLVDWLGNLDWDTEFVALGGVLTGIGFAICAVFMFIAHTQQAQSDG